MKTLERLLLVGGIVFLAGFSIWQTFKLAECKNQPIYSEVETNFPKSILVVDDPNVIYVANITFATDPNEPDSNEYTMTYYDDPCDANDVMYWDCNEPDPNGYIERTFYIENGTLSSQAELKYLQEDELLCDLIRQICREEITFSEPNELIYDPNYVLGETKPYYHKVYLWSKKENDYIEFDEERIRQLCKEEILEKKIDKLYLGYAEPNDVVYGEDVVFVLLPNGLVGWETID